MPRSKSFKAVFHSECCAWRNAIDRCNRPNHPQYNDYGGRGINVEAEWMDPLKGFMSFFCHIGPKPSPKHTLDRIDNDKGYVPGNVRWEADWKAQLRNRRKTRPIRDFGWGIGAYNVKGKDGRVCTQYSPLIEAHGTIQTLKQWSNDLGVAASTLSQRLLRGWSPEAALTKTIFNPHGKPRKGQ